MKRKIIGFGCACILATMMTMTALAVATASFNSVLPAYQGDTEVSTVKRATTSPTWQINISSIGTGTNAVCAWTELTDGYNLSSPYVQVSKGIKIMKYDSLPNVGKNVTLNLDNPVYSSSTVAVNGEWSPN